MSWVQVAPQLGNRTVVYDTIVYGGELYGGSSNDGALLKWNKSNAWTVAAPKTGSYVGVISLGIYSGVLFGALIEESGGTGRIAYFTGSAWTTASGVAGYPRIMVPAVGKLFVVYSSTTMLREIISTLGATGVRSASANSNWGDPTCGVYYQNMIWIGTDQGYLASVITNGSTGTAWTQRGVALDAAITSLCVHNGVLYIGTSDGRLMRWNGTAIAPAAAAIADGPAVTAMVSYNNTLYLGLSRSS